MITLFSVSFSWVPECCLDFPERNHLGICSLVMAIFEYAMTLNCTSINLIERKQSTYCANRIGTMSVRHIRIYARYNKANLISPMITYGPVLGDKGSIPLIQKINILLGYITLLLGNLPKFSKRPDFSIPPNNVYMEDQKLGQTYRNN